MEELLENYVKKVQVDGDFLSKCKIILITVDDIQLLKEFKEDSKLKLKISIEYEVFHDRIYTGKWSDVEDELRRMFLILSFLKAFVLMKESSKSFEKLIEAIRILDVGIMIGFGLEDCEWLKDFTQKLHDYVVKLNPPPLLQPLTTTFESPLNDCDIEISNQPSIEHFWTQYLYLHRPVKLTNCINHWPALKKWKDLNYLMKLAAYRTVPIELGKTYDGDDWGQNLFKFGDFMVKFMRGEGDVKTKAYLAQHDLFDQIPMLKNDFYTPDYCAISSEDPVIKSWIGPEGTISTMHTDDKCNLLCQVMGEKLIILASPNETESLYPYKGMLNNTTQIDAENLDFEKFPLTKNVKFYRIILKAGEMLYIPKLWWHYVRSLTPSISTSFWFNANDNFDDE